MHSLLKDMYMNIHTSFIYDSLKLKAAKKSMKYKMDSFCLQTYNEGSNDEKRTAMYLIHIKFSYRTLTQNSILHGALMFKNRGN